MPKSRSLDGCPCQRKTPMHNWGQLFLMLGLAFLVAIEIVGLSGEPEVDFMLAMSSDFSAQELDFKPMLGPPQLAARPLFRQTRRPPEIPVRDEAPSVELVPSVPSVPQTSSEQAPSLRYQLTAVVITGNEAVAYLINPADLGLIRLRKGDQIDGWTLHTVSPDSVVLGYGTQQQARLELWADARREEFSVPLSEDQDAQVDSQPSQGELSTPESFPAEPSGRPVRGPRSRAH